MKSNFPVILLHLVFSLMYISCSSDGLTGFRPLSRSENSAKARRDARSAITRGDYRFLGHSGGAAPSETAEGLPGLSRQIRERITLLGQETTHRSIRDAEDKELLAWRWRYAKMQSGKPKVRRDLVLGWDAPYRDIRLPAIGVVCAYFYTCTIEEPWHSRRILYIKTYNREMVQGMDERGRSMWHCVGVNIR